MWPCDRDMSATATHSPECHPQLSIPIRPALHPHSSTFLVHAVRSSPSTAPRRSQLCLSAIPRMHALADQDAVNFFNVLRPTSKLLLSSRSSPPSDARRIDRSHSWFMFCPRVGPPHTPHPFTRTSMFSPSICPSVHPQTLHPSRCRALHIDISVVRRPKIDAAHRSPQTKDAFHVGVDHPARLRGEKLHPSLHSDGADRSRKHNPHRPIGPSRNRETSPRTRTGCGSISTAPFAFWHGKMSCLIYWGEGCAQA